jgi:hypothetical protein
MTELYIPSRALLNPHTVCADGFTLSVQASEMTYCTPRVDLADRYTHVEVGFPSEPEPLLSDWQEVPGEDPCEGVYPYTPVEVVRAVIAKHGGIVSGRCPAGVYPTAAE